MTAEDVRDAKQIFLNALEFEGAERLAFVASACGADEELQRKVAALVRAHEGAEDFLAQPVVADESDALEKIAQAAGSGGGSAPKSPAPTRADLEVGNRVGDYRIERRIGEGGFGSVYLAVQEAPIVRPVALKVVRLGMDSEQVIARFEAERQALALMEHPSIAKVLDAGSTESGRPYFVMEFVDGDRVDDYCDNHGLTVRERVGLFEQICLAVQHAHQKGVIHRDIKPSNILVTEVDGRAVPKVIDFGVAKATGFRLADRTLTGDFQIVGTPEYMSPEQASPGELDIDTRTDVYSLGVVLYHLLIGLSPYVISSSGGVAGWLRAICEVEPLQPSTRLRRLDDPGTTIAAARNTTPERLQRELRGELDWIVMRAVQKERADRYPTAFALAEDLRRYLNHEAIEARPPSAVYRFRKFCHRHRLMAGSVIVAAIALTAAAVVSTTAAFVAIRSRDATRDALARSQEQAYIANINVAQAALRNNDSVAARRALQAAPGELRGWEWEHFCRRIDRSAVVHVPDVSPTMVEMHPSGKWAAFGTGDGTAGVLDAATGEVVVELTMLEGAIRSLLFSRTGEELFVGSALGDLVRWRWQTGGTVALEGHTAEVRGLATTPDGATLVSSSWDATARLWDLATNGEIHKFQHDSNVHQTRLSPDGTRIATACWDQTLRLWDIAGGEPILSVGGLEPGEKVGRWMPRRIASLEFTLDSEGLLALSRAQSLRLFDARDGELVWERQVHEDLPRKITLRPDGTGFVTTSRDRTAELWSFEGPTKLAVMRGHQHEVGGALFTPDSKHVLTYSLDRTMKLWDSTSGGLVSTLFGHEDMIFTARAAARGTPVATYGLDPTVRIWSLIEPLQDTLHGHDSFVTAVAFGPNTLITGGKDDQIRVLDLATGELRYPPLLPDLGADSLAVSPDGSLLASGSWHEPVVRLWDLATGAQLRTFEGHERRIYDLAFSADGARLITGSGDDTSRIWNVADGSQELLITHSDDVMGVDFALGESAVVVAGKDGRLQVHDSRTGELLSDIPSGAPGQIRCGSVSEDGRVFAVGSNDRSIRTFDLETGELLRVFEGHAAAVTSIDWLPDGSRFASGAYDRTVRLWDPTSGANVATLEGHPLPVQSVAFSRDGKVLASGGESYVTKLWRAAR